MAGRFQKGQPKIGGRKKGSRNKTTLAIKAVLQQAFDDIGGVEALVSWGKDNRTEFYRIWSKLIPNEIKNADGEAFRVGIVEEIVDANRREDDSPAPDSA